MTKNRKECIAIFSAYMPPHVGGIERYTSNLGKQLVKLGYQVIVVISNYGKLKSFEIVDDVIIIRLPIYNIFKNRYPIVKFGRIKRTLMKKLNEYNIKRVIVNARFYLTSLIGVRYANKRGILVYLVEHGSNYVTLDNKFIDFFANRYEDLLTFYLKKRVDGFYGVSDACGKWLKGFGINASGTWYNSIDLITNKKRKHNGINFLYAGRVIKQKGVYNILVAFNKLLSKYDNINLYIAGDGEDLSTYKKEFIHNRIHFLGKLDYEELLKYYEICDIFLYPPLWPEGLPTSILEAGMMKCAVIATDQGGIKEIIVANENGLMVSNDMIELENAMEKLILDSKLRDRLASALNKTVRAKFLWESTAKKILKDINLE